MVGVPNVYRRNLDAPVIRFADIFERRSCTVQTACPAPVRQTGLMIGFESVFRHNSNADVIRQELASEHGIVIGLRSVELRVRQWRRKLKAQKRATVRFETAPGHAIVGTVIAQAQQIGMQPCNCLRVRFCLRGLLASDFSQAENRSAKRASLLGRSRTLNFGSTPSDGRYLRMVFRDRPVLRQISRIDKCSRKCQRRITLNNAMSITP